MSVYAVKEKERAWLCTGCHTVVREVRKERVPTCPQCQGTDWSPTLVYTMTPTAPRKAP